MSKYIFSFLIFIFSSSCFAQNYSVAKPKIFELGTSFDAVREKAISKCGKVTEKSIVPITAPLAKESQKQIDCFGFLYAGKERKIELVFQDDQLDLIWILIPSDEKDEVISKMNELYGEPSMTIEYGTIYLQANAAFRNKPTEVLYASKRQVEAMLKILSKTN